MKARIEELAEATNLAVGQVNDGCVNEYTREAIRIALTAIVQECYERAARECAMTRQDILLLAVELNAGELRAVKAVLDSRERSIRKLKEEL